MHRGCFMAPSSGLIVEQLMAASSASHCCLTAFSWHWDEAGKKQLIFGQHTWWKGGFQLMCTWMICVSSAGEGRKCVWADVNWAAWISVRTERRESLPLKALCVGNMRARPKLRGEMTISNCPWLFSMSQLSTHITAPSLFTGTHLDLHPALCPYRVTHLKILIFTLNQTCVVLQRGNVCVNVVVCLWINPPPCLMSALLHTHFYVHMWRGVFWSVSTNTAVRV